MAKHIFNKRIIILMTTSLLGLYFVLVGLKNKRASATTTSSSYSLNNEHLLSPSSESNSKSIKHDGDLKRIPGEAIMSKMGNETLKAELGRSAWRLLHTMAGKFPYEPTKEEQNALLDFIYLFARLYPCGDCARHFKLVLEAHPPNVTNRETISQWACKVHNIVNERLKKPLFDCSKVGDMWKCGCAEDELENKNGTTSSTSAIETPFGGKFNAGAYKDFDEKQKQNKN